ncbi:14522_t:CDS:2, partial [Acaulospora colombiana]
WYTGGLLTTFVLSGNSEELMGRTDKGVTLFFVVDAHDTGGGFPDVQEIPGSQFLRTSQIIDDEFFFVVPPHDQLIYRMTKLLWKKQLMRRCRTKEDSYCTQILNLTTNDVLTIRQEFTKKEQCLRLPQWTSIIRES